MLLPVILLSDDAATRHELALALRHAGFAPEQSGRRPPTVTALPSGARIGAAAVVLDLGNEPGSGLDWCRAARRAWPRLLLCVVVRGPDPLLEVTALEQGADAVVTAPVDPRRLAAQLRALHRPWEAPGPAADLAVDPASRQAIVDGRQVQLTDGEFDVLAVLHRHRGCVVSRDALSLELRGRPCQASDRSLDLRIARLRRKLGDDSRAPRFIRSVRGEGYLLLAP